MHESADGPDRRVAMAQTASAAEKMDTITQIKELKGSEYMYVSETRRGQKRAGGRETSDATIVLA